MLKKLYFYCKWKVKIDINFIPSYILPKKIEKVAESNPTLAQCFCDLKIYDCSEKDFHKQIAKRLGNHFLASEADKIYARFQTYKKENSVLSSLRDTLLPKLISGEIRVPIQEE